MLASKNKYDLVIIGSGLSGSTAAAEAGLEGIPTLVVEKGKTTGGTGNYVEGVFAVNSKLQKAKNNKLTEKYIYDEEFDWTHGLANMAVWQNYIKQSTQNVDWLNKHGASISKMRTLGTGDDTWHIFDGHGHDAINKGLLPTAKQHEVEIITSAKAIRLEKDLTGKISGLEIKDMDSGKLKFIQTSHVILATGGYLNNKAMLNSNNNHTADRIVPVNLGKNTGDGIRLAWSIGAKRFGMGIVMMFGGQVFDDSEPGYKNWMRQTNRAATHEAGLWVNENGDRFANEDCTDIWAIAGNTLIRQEKVFAIFDQNQLDALHQNSFKGNYNYDKLKTALAHDLRDHKNYLTKADTIKALAAELDLPNLESNVERYNSLCQRKSDTDFHKDSQYLHPVQKGPFYAFELGIGAFCTLGGLKTNTKNQVLDDDGKVIDGLYAVGSDGSSVLVGDTYGVNVPGSEAGYCVYSGRNAVENLTAK